MFIRITRLLSNAFFADLTHFEACLNCTRVAAGGGGGMVGPAFIKLVRIKIRITRI